jgi:hypothetical protein
MPGQPHSPSSILWCRQLAVASHQLVRTCQTEPTSISPAFYQALIRSSSNAACGTFDGFPLPLNFSFFASLFSLFLRSCCRCCSPSRRFLASEAACTHIHTKRHVMRRPCHAHQQVGCVHHGGSWLVVSGFPMGIGSLGCCSGMMTPAVQHWQAAPDCEALTSAARCSRSRSPLSMHMRNSSARMAPATEGLVRLKHGPSRPATKEAIQARGLGLQGSPLHPPAKVLHHGGEDRPQSLRSEGLVRLFNVRLVGVCKPGRDVLGQARQVHARDARLHHVTVHQSHVPVRLASHSS